MIFPLRSEALTMRKGVCVGRWGGVGYSFSRGSSFSLGF